MCKDFILKTLKAQLNETMVSLGGELSIAIWTSKPYPWARSAVDACICREETMDKQSRWQGGEKSAVPKRVEGVFGWWKNLDFGTVAHFVVI